MPVRAPEYSHKDERLGFGGRLLCKQSTRYISVIPAPVEKVWPKVRAFEQWSSWHPDITQCEMLEQPDEVKVLNGYMPVRSARHPVDYYHHWTYEGIVSLNDAKRQLITRVCNLQAEGLIPAINSYNSEAHRTVGYQGTITLLPIVADDTTLFVWEASWEALPGSEQSFQQYFTKKVIAGLEGLTDTLAKEK